MGIAVFLTPKQTFLSCFENPLEVSLSPLRSFSSFANNACLKFVLDKILCEGKNSFLKELSSRTKRGLF